MWKLLSPPITLLSGRKARRSLLTNWALKVVKVAIIEGKAGNASGEARRNGATEAFKKSKPDQACRQPACRLGPH